MYPRLHPESNARLSVNFLLLSSFFRNSRSFSCIMDPEKDMMGAVSHIHSGQESFEPIQTVEHVEDKVESAETMKLDKHGLPLTPQPTNNKDDPLVSTSRWWLPLATDIKRHRTGLQCSSS